MPRILTFMHLHTDCIENEICEIGISDYAVLCLAFFVPCVLICVVPRLWGINVETSQTSTLWLWRECTGFNTNIFGGFSICNRIWYFFQIIFFHCSNSFHRLIAFCKSAEAAFNEGFMLFSTPSSNPKPFCVSSFSGTLSQQWKKVCL